MTHDDLTEALAAIAALELAEQNVRDLADRMKRKGDSDRAHRLYVAAPAVGRARREVEGVFA